MRVSLCGKRGGGGRRRKLIIVVPLLGGGAFIAVPCGGVREQEGRGSFGWRRGQSSWVVPAGL